MNLNELIFKAINHLACDEEIIKIKQYETFEEAIQDEDAPYWCYWYAENVIKGRWEECEHIILRSPRYSYYYTLTILKRRWEECESIILTSPEFCYMYACYIIKERWLEAEPLIFSDLYAKQGYCKHFNIIE